MFSLLRFRISSCRSMFNSCTHADEEMHPLYHTCRHTLLPQLRRAATFPNARISITYLGIAGPVREGSARSAIKHSNTMRNLRLKQAQPSQALHSPCTPPFLSGRHANKTVATKQVIITSLEIHRCLKHIPVSLFSRCFRW
jgi:hypothetical protein